MIDRRQFLASGTAVLSVPVFANPVHAATRSPHLPFDRIIVDGRIAEPEGIASLAKTTAIPCNSIRGDLAKLWFETLRNTLTRKNTVIAGITLDLDSEVMRTFARDVGYQQVERIDISTEADTIHATAAQTSGLQDLVDYFATPIRTSGLPVHAQLAAWVIAPIQLQG